MRTRSLIVGLTFLGMGPVLLSAQPPIVNIDAIANCATDSSNAVEVTIPAGTWLVRQIDTSGGGDFTAWSPWADTTNCSGDTCETGWIMGTNIMAPDVPHADFGTYDPYATEELAFENDAGEISITLASEQTVKFWIQDTPCTDNRGGISLEITESVPAMPSGWLMLLVAVLLLVGSLYLRRRTAS